MFAFALLAAFALYWSKLSKKHEINKMFDIVN